MRLLTLSGLSLALFTACDDLQPKSDDTADTGTIEDSEDTAEPACEAPEQRTRDESLPEWSYHHPDHGASMWGNIGYATCDEGAQQSPINIDDSVTLPSEVGLSFQGYDRALPLRLWNNGHTLEVEVEASEEEPAPHIVYEGRTFTLVQLHAHAVSEHTIDGAHSAMELHLVHKDIDGNVAVVGLLLDEAEAENEALGVMLSHDPGPDLEVACEATVSLGELVPTASPFYHYLGSLTTPSCAETVEWFVLTDRGEVSVEQAELWQLAFGGTTNRPTQALSGRGVLKHTPGG